MYYHINPKCSDGQVGANNLDPDQTPQNAASVQDLSCLPFNKQYVCTYLQVVKWTAIFKDMCGKGLWCPKHLGNYRSNKYVC